MHFNELQKVQALLGVIIDTKPEGSSMTVAAWIPKLTNNIDELSEGFSLREFYRWVLALESECTLRVLPGRQKDQIKEDIEKLSQLFSVRSFGQPAQNWRNASLKDLEYVHRGLYLLEGCFSIPPQITVDDVKKSIGELRQQVLGADEITDHDKSVLQNCLFLVEQATTSLESGNIAEFRQVAYSAAGRISFEVSADGSDKIRATKIRGIADDLLRIVGAWEVVTTTSGLIGMKGATALIGMG